MLLVGLPQFAVVVDRIGHFPLAFSETHPPVGLREGRVDKARVVLVAVYELAKEPHPVARWRGLHAQEEIGARIARSLVGTEGRVVAGDTVGVLVAPGEEAHPGGAAQGHRNVAARGEVRTASKAGEGLFHGRDGVGRLVVGEDKEDIGCREV